MRLWIIFIFILLNCLITIFTILLYSLIRYCHFFLFLYYLILIIFWANWNYFIILSIHHSFIHIISLPKIQLRLIKLISSSIQYVCPFKFIWIDFQKFYTIIITFMIHIHLNLILWFSYIKIVSYHCLFSIINWG